MRLDWLNRSRSRFAFGLAAIAISCSSESRVTTPPPADFGDATVDVGPKKDAAPDTQTPPDAASDGLLADASDVLDAPSDCVVGKTCVGADMPTWKLEDFQPKSPGFKKTYGLDGFKGKVTVVALLSGW